MTPRVLVVVPTFDNPRTVASVVGGLRSLRLPILVVDDGSREPVAARLAAAEVDAGVTTVRHAANRGKGAALKTAFAWALAHDFTHVLTVDGDGQHLASEAAKLAAATDEHPWSLIVGVRAFAADVPGVSRFGRAFSNFWIRYETGRAVADSQSGMRVYPLFAVQSLRFRTNRFDFEVESMTRLLWAGVGLHEVPVAVHYPPRDERVSHFKAFKDNARISILNVGLVAWSLFRAAWTTRRAAASVAIAAGVTRFVELPPLGVFAILAAAVVALRLNASIAVLIFALRARAGPAFAPLLDLAFAAWSLATYAWALARERAARRAPGGAVWSGKSRGGTIGNWILRTVSRGLGLGATYVCLLAITPYFYVFAPRARRSSLEFLRAARPGLGPLGRRRHVLAHFFTFGTVLLDRLFQSFYAEPQFGFTANGLQAFEAARVAGKGVVLVTAHAGSWDMMSGLLAARFPDAPCIVAEVVTSPNDPRSHAPRASLHNERSPLLAYRDALAQGGTVCMMADRPLSAKLALVPFFGKLAAFDLTPFRLALTTGAALVYCFALKSGFRRYEVTLVPGSVDASAADRDAAAEAALRSFVRVLESEIRQRPHQWFNFFPFFSTRPAAATP